MRSLEHGSLAGQSLWFPDQSNARHASRVVHLVNRAWKNPVVRIAHRVLSLI